MGMQVVSQLLVVLITLKPMKARNKRNQLLHLSTIQATIQILNSMTSLYSRFRLSLLTAKLPKSICRRLRMANGCPVAQVFVSADGVIQDILDHPIRMNCTVSMLTT